MTTLQDTSNRARGGIVGRHPLLSFFVLAFGLSWLTWLPFILADRGLDVLPFHVPAVLNDTLVGAYVGPIISAFVVTAVADGRVGLRHWARRLFRLRVGLRWYVFVLLGTPAALVAMTFVLPGAWTDVRLPTTGVLLAYVPVLLLQVVTTGVAEEPGWRDFALPRMQTRLGAVGGTLLLGVLWGGWHLPLFVTDWAGWPDIDWYQPVEFMASAVALSFPITWLFNRTGQSLPIVMLFHANVNTTLGLVWPQIFLGLDQQSDSLHVLLITSTVAAAAVVLATRGRLGQ